MAVDYYLQFDGIEGEVPVLSGPRLIRLQSWGWNARNPSSVAYGGGSGIGKVTFEDFTFIALFDKASPQFFKRICAGTHVTSASFAGFKAGAFDAWLGMAFQKVFITYVQSQAYNEIPAVNVGFSFEVVEIEYKMQKKDGSLISTGPITYNRKANKLS